MAAWLLGAAGVAAAGVCHIHPPADVADAPPALIGPFADAMRCEHERRGRFGASGRCHCTADFTPDWLSPRRAPGREDPGRLDNAQPGAPGALPLP